MALSAAEQEAIAARVTELRDGLIERFFTAFGNASVKFDAEGIQRQIVDELTKERRNGTIEYHLQMVTGAFVSPGRKEVLPLCPELIRRQDGSTKNDCERNATKRFIADFRREHPHLKVIVTEDGLSANAPHIKDLMAHDLRYILSAKPGDHAFLFSLFRHHSS